VYVYPKFACSSPEPFINGRYVSFRLGYSCRHSCEGPYSSIINCRVPQIVAYPLLLSLPCLSISDLFPSNHRPTRFSHKDYSLPSFDRRLVRHLRVQRRLIGTRVPVPLLSCSPALVSVTSAVVIGTVGFTGWDNLDLLCIMLMMTGTGTCFDATDKSKESQESVTICVKTRLK
jgi:hypothetical protein